MVGQGLQPPQDHPLGGLDAADPLQGLVVGAQHKGPMAEKVLPVPNEMDGSQQLTFVRRVVFLRFLKLLGSVGNDPLLPVLLLGEHAADGARVPGPVGVQDEGLLGLEVGVGKHRGSSEEIFQLGEGFSGLVSYFKLCTGFGFCQLCQWCRNLTEVLHELSVVRNLTQKGAHCLEVGRERPLVHDLGVLLGHGDAGGGHVVAQVLHVVLEQLALVGLKCQTCLFVSLKNPSETIQMLCEVRSMNAGVVQVGDGDRRGDALQHLLHQAAVRGGGIAQPERHLLELKKTPGGGKSRLFSVLWSDGHHVVGARAVQAGEHLAAGHPGEVVVDVGEGESIGCR